MTIQQAIDSGLMTGQEPCDSCPYFIIQSSHCIYKGSCIHIDRALQGAELFPNDK